MQGFERVEAVNLINVDVIKLQTLQAMIYLRHDVFARRATAIRTTGTHFKVDLRRHDNFITVEPEVFDVATSDFFTRSHLVNIRRVEVVNTQFNRTLENLLAVLVSFRPRKNAVFFARLTKAHHSQTDSRYVHACISELYVFHIQSSFFQSYLF